MQTIEHKNSIGDIRAQHHREIVFNMMRYRRCKTVQGSGDFHSEQCQLCEGQNNTRKSFLLTKMSGLDGDLV